MGMPERDKLNLANKNWLDVVVDYRRVLVTVIVIVTAFFIYCVPQLRTDPTLKSGLDTTAKDYLEYEQFHKEFGNEEFILVAIKTAEGIDNTVFLKSLQEMTKEIEKLDKIAEVVSLSTLRIFQKRGELFGNYPVVRLENGKYRLPASSTLESMKKALPLMDLLVSADLKTAGILIRLHDQWKYDTKANRQIVATIRETVSNGVPAGTEFRIIGAPLIRGAVVRYSVQTGIIFGCLCMLIGTVVSAYVFKSVRITLIGNVILAVCVIWVLGLMAFLRIPLNSTTALSFGFIPITTVEIVIHMVVRYNQFHQTCREKSAALKQAVRWLARPCFICSATTAVGFGSLMVSSIPMVRQLGFIMSLGIMASCGLAVVLTPAFFMVMKSFDNPEQSGMLRDWLDRVISKLEYHIFAHSRWILGIGVVITVFLFAGTPFIRTDSQILRMLSDSTPEIRDLAFVERNLGSVNSLELVLDANDAAFKKSGTWKQVEEVERSLRKIPEVVDIDSLYPLLEYLGAVVAGTSVQDTDLFKDERLVPELLGITSLSSEGSRVRLRFLSPAFDRLRISIRFKNLPGVPIGTTIEKIRAAADKAMQGTARASVTGDLAVAEYQTANLIRDQIVSMFLAATMITGLMMIQMNSVILGLICLIPNIPPVAAVFGIMGWFGIALDSVTVFAATVAVGLAVDNTIHYLTQLRREIQFNPQQGMESCVATAYRLTAKQIVSWTTVTLFGFLALTVSPFRPVVFFGALGCASLALGMYGDLVFMQSLILISAPIRNTIRRLIEKQTSE